MHCIRINFGGSYEGRGRFWQRLLDEFNYIEYTIFSKTRLPQKSDLNLTLKLQFPFL